MSQPLRVLGHRTDPAPSPHEEKQNRERERLLEMLAHQQRVAQAGLITAGLAHDLRNHLTVLYGTAALAQKSAKPEDWREALAKIEDLCLQMTDVTTTFLDFARRRDHVEERRFSVRDALAQADRLVRPLAKKQGVSLSTRADVDVEVAGDLRALSQAVVNLATNAIRACAETRGRLDILATTPREGSVRIEVVDSGPGIPEDLRKSLFRPFVTGHSREDGHGIGLFIVRQAVRKLGGRIRMRTSADGTVFTIDLPTG